MKRSDNIIKSFFLRKGSQSTIRIGILVLLAFYIFYIPSMSYTAKLNLIAYILLPLLGILSFFYASFYKINYLRKIRIPLLFLVLFCIYAFVSTLFGVKQFSSLPRLYFVSLSGLILFASFSVFDKEKNVLLFVAFSMFSFVIFYFLYSFIFSFDRLYDWLFLKTDIPLTLLFFKKIGLNGGGGTNIISSYFGTCSILFLFISLFGGRKKYLFFLFPFFICIFAGITTASRQFVIGIFVSSIVLFFIAIRHRPIIILITIFSIILLIILFLVLPVFEPIREPILEGFGISKNSRGDKSAYTRLIMQIEAFEIGGYRLFFGYGMDGFETISGWNGYAHNTFANLYVSFGILGLLLFFLPVLLIFLKIKKSKHQSLPLLIGFLVYYLIIAFFIVWYKDKIFYIVLGLLLYFYSMCDEHDVFSIKQGYLETSI